MLYNRDFLKRLDEHRTKVVHARIIALSMDESPIETIEGRVTQGSINLDGDSAVRRTCSLTLVAQDFNQMNFAWGLNTKFKLEIGLENMIDPNYPEIIWFKQGTYFISSFSTSHSIRDYNISIQGKDKMCALNGELGGVLSSSIDCGTVEEYDAEGNRHVVKLTLKEIIRNLVHLYGGEPLHNIIINDLDMSGLELLEYRYSETTPLYLWRKVNETYYGNVILNGKHKCRVGSPGSEERTFDSLTPSELKMLVNPFVGSNEPAYVYIENDEDAYYIAKINYGDTAGYRFTDLTYAGDLIGGIGETITSILDKVKNMLGDFEYFYDLDGRFIFQRKKIADMGTWSVTSSDAAGNSIVHFQENIDYTFSSGTLVTTFNNNPNLSNLRNDFSVWGERQGISGKTIPVHMRYAIDQKPSYYKALDNTIYDVGDGLDWREIIYQMAKDYYSNSNSDNLTYRIAQNNLEHYPSGKTGYENYYIDLLSFWRDIYDPSISKSKEAFEADRAAQNLILNDAVSSEEEKAAAKKKMKEIDTILSKHGDYYYEGANKYWSKTVYEAPQSLNFWFDFLDGSGELSKFSVKNIGCRPKAINDSNVKAIYFRETPNILFTKDFSKDMNKSGAYTFIQVNEGLMNTMFSISAQGKSAKMVIDDLIYRHVYCVESTTINTIPIYYLEPNSRIHVVDKNANLDGYYDISKLSIPLTYNGTMSITATKAVQNI